MWSDSLAVGRVGPAGTAPHKCQSRGASGSILQCQLTRSSPARQESGETWESTCNRVEIPRNQRVAHANSKSPVRGELNCPPVSYPLRTTLGTLKDRHSLAPRLGDYRPIILRSQLMKKADNSISWHRCLSLLSRLQLRIGAARPKASVNAWISHADAASS